MKINEYQMEYDLYHQPFSIEMHKSMPYHVDLEVMIAPDGTVEYAMPSHQEYLIHKAMNRLQCSRTELEDACPKEFYTNYLAWLIPQSGGYIPVWENYVLPDIAITKAQLATLKHLKLNGLYKGKLPKILP